MRPGNRQSSRSSKACVAWVSSGRRPRQRPMADSPVFGLLFFLVFREVADKVVDLEKQLDELQ
jgi:hypothetical protein